jgi:protein O-mannosyl-transferase
MVSVITKEPASMGAPPRWPRWLSAAGLVLSVALVYWNSLQAPFLFDDRGAVVNNPTIRHLASWAVFTPPSDGSTTTGRPMVNFSLAVNYAFGGTAVWGYHAFNAAFHALAALALMGIVRRTLSGPVLGDRLGAAAQPLAFLTALLWAVHPLQTESVTCVAQRTESLCGLFYLLTLYTFIRGAIPAGRTSDLSDGFSRQRIWLSLSIIACLVGMGTKEVMVTAPVIVLLYDRTFIAGSFSAAWRRRWTWYLALAGTWLLLGWLVARVGGARGSSAGFGFGVSWWQYLLKQSEAILLYLKLCFWPHPLVLDYGTGVVRSVREVWWQGLGVVGLLAGTVWALRRKPALGFAGAWFFVILAPSSSIVPLVGQTMAEHRMYLPLAGVMSLAVVSVYQWSGARSLGVLGAVAAAFGAVAVVRNHDYHDPLRIWADSAAHYPQNARAHNNLAWALQMQGKPDEANAHFARAIELQPGYVSAHYNWGVALLDQKRTKEAITEFEIAVHLAPGHADAFVNLANALMQVQHAVEAVPLYEQALRLQPGADVHYDLGVALVAVGRGDEAAGHFRAALREEPALAEAHYQLALLADEAGRLVEAEREYGETLRLAPDHVASHGRLGLVLARGERLAPAAEHFRAVIRLQPEDADAHANLGNVLLLQGQAREAIGQYEEALRLRPGDARTRENLQIARESLR